MSDPTKPSPARFLLLVNDGANGCPTGHIEGVDFMGDGEVRLELRDGVWPPSRSPRFTPLDQAVRISRRTFPILGYRTWVGNWCWDAVSMRADIGADLLNYLRDLGWQCEGGISPYFEMWSKGRKFRASDAAILTPEQLAARKDAR